VLRDISRVSFFFIILTVLVCSTAELILLEIKYGFFAGGFLQVYPLRTLFEKIGFTLVFYSFNFLFYSLLFLLFKFVLFPLRLKNTTVGFNFFMVASIVTAVTLTIQLQLHKYFADAMNAALIKTIAGGNLNSAVAYVSDELILFGIGFLILLVAYFILNRLVRPILVNFNDDKLHKISHVLLSIFLLVILLFPTTYLVNINETFRNNVRYSNAYAVISNKLNDISDFDDDGFGSFRYPFDNQLFNSSIYPGALDVPDNGIDEDGLFGDFVYVPDFLNSDHENTIASKKHVVIVVLESARADLIGKKINGRYVSPNLNKLASEGSSFPEMYSHTGFTSSSLSILFSGKFGNFPSRQSIFKEFNEASYQVNIYSGQDESWGNLDTKLKTRESSTFFYDAQTGIEKRVFSSTLPSSIKLSEETLWKEFNHQIETTDWKIPQFIYFNFQAAHFPYFHQYMTTNFVETGIPRSEINSDNKAWLENTYWNSLNYADFYLGKVIDDLKKAGVWEDTLLVVTGDHGEELFDQNHLGHGFLISKTQLNIPFVTNQPKFEIPQPAGLVDIKQAIHRFIENKPNPQIKDKQFVFQYIGSLSRPQKIAIRFSQNKVYELDLLKMQVNVNHLNINLPLDIALEDDEIKQHIQQLVDHWAHIRWSENLSNDLMVITK
jgi:phosphoglycerol transferase MdoB-like AlkP superfamily enzyme